MGLFNSVKVEQKLPLDDTLRALNHNWQSEEYQTKELEDNVMITYIIRDNKLYEEKVEGHWQEVTPDEKKRDSKLGLLWDSKFVRDKTEQVWRENYTGTFTFGCVIYGDTIDATDFYPDWRCVVVNGEVKELTILSEYSKHSSRDRIEQQIIWDKEKETHDKKMRCPVYKTYYNYYVMPLDKFGWDVSRKLYSITKLVEWIRFYGIRKLITFLTPR